MRYSNSLNPLIIGAWVWQLMLVKDATPLRLNPLIIGAWVWL